MRDGVDEPDQAGLAAHHRALGVAVCEAGGAVRVLVIVQHRHLLGVGSVERGEGGAGQGGGGGHAEGGDLPAQPRLGGGQVGVGEALSQQTWGVLLQNKAEFGSRFSPILQYHPPVLAVCT